MKNTRRSKLIIYVSLIILILSGCSAGQQKPNTNNSGPKTPKVLNELDEQILKVMYDIDSIPAIEELLNKQKLSQSSEGQSQGESKDSKSSQEKEPKEEESKKGGSTDEKSKSEEEQKI